MSRLTRLKDARILPPNTTIHLIGQWYWPDRPHRQRELVRVLAKNLNNSAIHSIHFIQPTRSKSLHRKTVSSHDPDILLPVSDLAPYTRLQDVDPYFPMDALRRKLRLYTTLHPGRLLASDAFAYASKHLKSRIAILANQDIYFDATLRLLRESPDSDLGPWTSYFLSRYEESPRAEKRSSIGTQCGPKFVGSHDAFVFVPPLPAPLIERCRFELGSWGIEARLLWEFEQFGIEGRNPCEDIKIWHVHMGGIKDAEVVGDQTSRQGGAQEKQRVMPEVNVNGKSSIAFPDKLKTRFKKVADEIWGQQWRQEQ
ncbi:hypothetical protein HDU96_009844 [Phlyctochytrium bullatum]|nr:hypothetical protein HDU96_009844 [Phlyctochytrium bullatum]